MKIKKWYSSLWSGITASVITLSMLLPIANTALAADPAEPPPPVTAVRKSISLDPAHVNVNEHKYWAKVEIDTGNVTMIPSDIVLGIDMSGSMLNDSNGNDAFEEGTIPKSKIEKDASIKFVKDMYDVSKNEAAVDTQITVLPIGDDLDLSDPNLPYPEVDESYDSYQKRLADYAKINGPIPTKGFSPIVNWTPASQSSSAVGALSNLDTEIDFYEATSYVTTLKNVKTQLDAQEAAGRNSKEYLKVVVFMTDGEPKRINPLDPFGALDPPPGWPAGEPTGSVDEEESAIKAAFADLMQAHPDVIFHTVAIGSEADNATPILKWMADEGNGAYFGCKNESLETDMDKVLEDIRLHSLTVARKTDIEFNASKYFDIVPNSVLFAQKIGDVEKPLTTGVTLTGNKISIQNFPLKANTTATIRFALICTEHAAGLDLIPETGTGGFKYERQTSYDHPFIDESIAHAKHSYSIKYKDGVNGTLTPSNVNETVIWEII